MFTKLNAKVVIEYANNNMNQAKTAKACYISPSTTSFHLDNVYKHTGLNPRNFFDLVKLVPMAKEFLRKNNPLQT